MSSAWGLSWGNAWANSWGLLIPSFSRTRGGVEDYKKYRKYLEALNGIKTLDDLSLVKAVNELASLPVNAPEIKRITQNKTASIDYEKLNNEIVLLSNFIDAKIKRMEAQILRMQKDEEEVFVLLMCI